MSSVVPHSSENDIERLEALCERLAGFGADVSLEWVDGFLTALAASRRAIALDEALPAMFDDAFARAFADPADAAQATATAQARFDVLKGQLDPEALLDGPDTLRIAPLMLSYDDDARREVVEAGHMSAEEAEELLQTGALWAEGFRAAIEAFAADWPEASTDDEEDAWFDDCLMRVMALMLSPADLTTYAAEHYPGETLSRDELIDDACFGVQDLRVYWLDHAPKPETRRVEPTPGRNDLCPCGSGKKFKKCHGAG
ncbi:UPF0149 family protein [Aquincola sp. S2]|uniref:UPF0149 family protein n=1 Tax=Pseudaquabacterium terrae TaxID=2732868 RepID=A0ABX2EM80_9BURK|nr:UPF0149 family protein [Aquabacterium terrae]NRF69721.1 UPF0149 family protein [Aquabacterium terrae]